MNKKKAWQKMTKEWRTVVHGSVAAVVVVIVVVVCSPAAIVVVVVWTKHNTLFVSVNLRENCEVLSRTNTCYGTRCHSLLERLTDASNRTKLQLHSKSGIDACHNTRSHSCTRIEGQMHATGQENRCMVIAVQYMQQEKMPQLPNKSRTDACSKTKEIKQLHRKRRAGNALLLFTAPQPPLLLLLSEAEGTHQSARWHCFPNLSSTSVSRTSRSFRDVSAGTEGRPSLCQLPSKLRTSRNYVAMKV